MLFERTCVPVAGPAVEVGSADWRLSALCAEVDREVFFPDPGVSAESALRVCRRCGVAAECLADALAGDVRFGVWGGTTEGERKALREGLDAAAADEAVAGRPPVAIEAGTDLAPMRGAA